MHANYLLYPHSQVQTLIQRCSLVLVTIKLAVSDAADPNGEIMTRNSNQSHHPPSSDIRTLA